MRVVGQLILMGLQFPKRQTCPSVLVTSFRSASIV
jgi:hypothetical protein